jgi:hypothetical protein
MESLLSSLASTTTTTVEDLLFNSSTVDYGVDPIMKICSETGQDCVIDHTITCVGDPEYCNLTKEEYEELLFDYIAPTVPEWILIFSHIVVFLMGLVSRRRLPFIN